MTRVASITLGTGKVIAVVVALGLHVVLAFVDFSFTALGGEPHDSSDW